MSDASSKQKPITLTIDGRTVTVNNSKTTVLEAAKQVGIEIPTLCYHARLSAIGSCRVCLVKINGIDEPVASCTTAVAEGMEVITEDEQITRMRKQAIQFILLNHPLECPVCDKAGECSLQDITYKLNVARQDYSMEPAKWDNDTKSPLIFRSDGRCIRCGRCVAICAEVQDVRALDFVKRGYDTAIAPTTGETLDCEFCGQCVSICPVGALLEKPFLHKSRVWDLNKTETVCGFCGAGCAVEVGERFNKLYRVTSDRENTHNKGDLCSRGKFGFYYLADESLQPAPRLKVNNELRETSYERAVEEIAKGFKRVLNTLGPKAVAGIGSARMLNEDAFAFATLMKDCIGTPHLDTEAGFGYRQMVQRAFGGPKGSFDDLEKSDAVLVFGSDLAVEMPVPCLRVIAAAKKNDSKVINCAPFGTKLDKVSTQSLTYTPGKEQALALALCKAAVDGGFVDASVTEKPEFATVSGALKTDLAVLCETAGVAVEKVNSAAKTLFAAKNRAMVVGGYGYRSCVVRNAVLVLAWLLAPQTYLVAADRANAQGVVEAGCTPGDEGDSYRQIIKGIKEGRIRALWVAGSDPVALLGDEADCLKKLEFLVVQDPFFSETAAMANVYLPAAAWTQKAGHYTSVEGRLQPLGQALKAADHVKADSRVFLDVAEQLGIGLPEKLEDFTLDEVIEGYGKMGRFDDTQMEVPKVPELDKEDKAGEGAFWLVRGGALFMNGTMASRSNALLEVCPGPFAALNPASFAELKLEEGDSVKVSTDGVELDLSAVADEKIPAGVALVIDNFPEAGVSRIFGDVYAGVKGNIEKL